MEYYGSFDPQELPHMPAEAVTQLGTVSLPSGHLAVLGDMFDCQGSGRKRCY